MRFGIDARMIDAVMDGAGRVTQGLLDELPKFPQHEFVIFHRRHLKNRPPSPNIEYRALETRISSVANLIATASTFNAAGLDALWYPFFDLPFFLRCPAALVCHGLHFIEDPMYFAAGKRWRHPIVVRLTKNRMRAAGTVIAVSRTVARQATELAGIREDRVTVIYNPIFLRDAGIASATPVPAEERRYILYVGTNRAHKNLSTLIEAVARVPDARLVMAGSIDPQYPDPRAMLRDRGLAPDRARHVGPAGDTQLEALYRGAMFVALPSLYEGFGLPAVEAAVRGRAVLGSDIEAFREVLGDDGAIYVPARDPAAWARAIVLLAHDAGLREGLAKAASHRAKSFVNSTFAARTIAALERIAQAPR